MKQIRDDFTEYQDCEVNIRAGVLNEFDFFSLSKLIKNKNHILLTDKKDCVADACTFWFSLLKNFFFFFVVI